MKELEEERKIKIKMHQIHINEENERTQEIIKQQERKKKRR